MMTLLEVTKWLAFLAAYGTPLVIAAICFVMWRRDPSPWLVTGLIASVIGAVGYATYIWRPAWFATAEAVPETKLWIAVGTLLNFGSFVAVVALLIHVLRRAAQQRVPADGPASRARG